ncbi:hypothetical protein CBL_05296 [Carabus blaptoides fortunei]
MSVSLEIHVNDAVPQNPRVPHLSVCPPETQHPRMDTSNIGDSVAREDLGFQEVVFILLTRTINPPVSPYRTDHVCELNPRIVIQWRRLATGAHSILFRRLITDSTNSLITSAHGGWALMRHFLRAFPMMYFKCASLFETIREMERKYSVSRR